VLQKAAAPKKPAAAKKAAQAKKAVPLKCEEKSSTSIVQKISN
jgi:hypothetical protein